MVRPSWRWGRRGRRRALLGLEQCDRAALLHRADGDELADIGVAAAARAQQGRAGRNIFDLRDTDFSHDLFLLSLLLQCKEKWAAARCLLRRGITRFSFREDLCKDDIQHERDDDAVDRADKERPVQERQSLDKAGEARKRAAGDAGEDGAHGKGDNADGGEAGADGEVLLLALADDPVGRDQYAGERRDEGGHEGQEALEGVEQTEGSEQRADAAGNASRDLELAFIKAEKVAQGKTAGVGVGHVGRPGGEHEGDKADEGNAERGEDGRDVILAGDNAHQRAGHQHEETGGDDADDGGLHHVAAALGKAAVVGGDDAAEGEGGDDHGDAEHQAGGSLGRIVCDGAAAVVGGDAGDQTVQADDDEQRDGNVVEPLEALEAHASRQQHDDAPDDGADGDKYGRGFASHHVSDHVGKGAAAGGGLDAEPADAGDGEERTDDVARTFLAQRTGGHYGDRKARIACLHTDADHISADEAIADQDGRDDLAHAQSAAGQHAADHQARNADHAARPDRRDGQPALALRLFYLNPLLFSLMEKAPLSGIFCGENEEWRKYITGKRK